MKTKHAITYSSAPYGVIATIPAGTPCTPASNLPGSPRYWVAAWPGMSEKAESWRMNYGFLVNAEEVESEKYAIRIALKSGGVSYLTHRGRSSWALRTAKKHAGDILTGKTGIDAATVENIRLEVEP